MRIGGIELLYDRSPDYQALLRSQGPAQLTILAEENKELLFVYSFSAGKKWIHGKLESCAYIGDFRTNRSRKAATVWRKYYAEFLRVMKSDPEYGGPKYVLTAILKKNAEALRNLVTSKKNLGFRYDFLTEMDMVNVYGQLPWAKLSSIITLPATAADRDALLNFLIKCEKNKLFGANFEGTASDWDVREKQWHGFALENFLIQKDISGEIVACTLPWDPGFAKRMTVTKAPSLLILFFKLLKWVGFSMPGVGESLKTTYMTHLNVDSSQNETDCVRSFLQYILKSGKDRHMISFADERGISNDLKGFIQQKVPVLLYTVALNGEEALTKNSESVSFEMGLV